MVHVIGGHRLERRRSLLGIAAIAVPLWLASCTDGDDDDSGANPAGAGMTSTDMGGSAGSTPGAGAPARGGSASGSAGNGAGGTASAGGGAGGTASAAGSGSSAGLGGTGGASGDAGTGGVAAAGTAGDGGAGTGGGTGGSEPQGGRGGIGGGTTGGAGTGGGSSIGGRGPMPGYECGDLSCVPGQVCVSCGVGVTPVYDQRCAPDPDVDPDGYAQVIKDCQMIYELDECDGPEDCPPEEHCVYTDESRGRSVCDAEPVVGVTANCCFACDAVPRCTLCWSDADCPETFICVRSVGQPSDGPGGCRLAE